MRSVSSSWLSKASQSVSPKMILKVNYANGFGTDFDTLREDSVASASFTQSCSIINSSKTSHVASIRVNDASEAVYGAVGPGSVFVIWTGFDESEMICLGMYRLKSITHSATDAITEMELVDPVTFTDDGTLVSSPKTMTSSGALISDYVAYCLSGVSEQPETTLRCNRIFRNEDRRKTLQYCLQAMNWHLIPYYDVTNGEFPSDDVSVAKVISLPTEDHSSDYVIGFGQSHKEPKVTKGDTLMQVSVPYVVSTLERSAVDILFNYGTVSGGFEDEGTFYSWQGTATYGKKANSLSDIIKSIEVKLNGVAYSYTIVSEDLTGLTIKSGPFASDATAPIVNVRVIEAGGSLLGTLVVNGNYDARMSYDSPVYWDADRNYLCDHCSAYSQSASDNDAYGMMVNVTDYQTSYASATIRAVGQRTLKESGTYNSVNDASGALAQNISNPMITSLSIARICGDGVKDALRHQFTIEADWKADPRLELLDIIGVERFSDGSSGTTISDCRVYYLKLTYDGGFRGQMRGLLL